jgi:hypothetical protein
MVAFAAMNPRPPATSARLCRRALASALTVPPGHVRLSPFAPCVACHRSSDGLHPIAFPMTGVMDRSIGGASPVDLCLVHPIREHDRRIAEPRWLRCNAVMIPFGARWHAFSLSNRVDGVWSRMF